MNKLKRLASAPAAGAPDDASAQGRLIVVSNRVMLPGQTQAGGLAQALLALLQERGGCWMGWSGSLSAAMDAQIRQEGPIRYVTWDLQRQEFDAFYRDYANRALWPLLHGRVDLMAFKRRALQGYLAVNQHFADRIAAEAGDADTIWVHDYHLIPLAALLRQRGLKARIGFFLHTPLPPLRTLTALPQHRAVLALLGAYDLVGLQTAADARHLRTYLAAEAQALDLGDALEVPNFGRVEVRDFPIGTDPDALAALADEAEGGAAVRELRGSLGRSDLLIGVDRLDYSKGLPQRLQAFGHLLDHDPSLAGRATYLQLTPESRREVSEYRQLSREVQRLVGDINGHHAGPAWTPVRYVNRSVPHSVLAGYYRCARVGLVTPLRDGMNLVAKEYLACQRGEDPGVLVLSEFAGAAAELAESALIMNPHDIEGCARAIGRALSMSMDERVERWQRAMQGLRAGNVHRWCADFLAALAQCAPRGAGTAPTPALRHARGAQGRSAVVRPA